MTLARTAVAITLALLALSPVAAPALAQTDQQGPALTTPEDLRQLQARWMGQLARDLDNLTREENLTRADVAPLLSAFNETAKAYQGHQWRAVASGLVSLRQEATYLVVDRAASRVDDSHRVFINATDPTFNGAVAESRALQKDIKRATENITTTRGLETLYLAARFTAEGNEMLRQYPLHRDLVVTGGNKTLTSILRALVHGPVGAEWSFRYARDLVELAPVVDARGEGAPVALDAFPDAVADMHDVVRSKEPMPSDSNFRAALNATVSRGDWVLATAIGEVLVEANFGSTLHRAQQVGATNEARLARALLEDAGDLGLLMDLHAAGYEAVHVRDAYATGITAANAFSTSFPSMASAAAQLRGVRVSGDVLLAVSAAPSDEGGDPVETEGADESFPTGVALGGVAVGAVAGAAVAAVVAAARRRENA